MARFTGPQHRGAIRQLRERRRIEADVRNALTPPHRRARHGGQPRSKRKAAER